MCRRKIFDFFQTDIFFLSNHSSSIPSLHTATAKHWNSLIGHLPTTRSKNRLTWEAFLIARGQKRSRRRDRRHRVPAGHDIRLHRVPRRKFQHLLLLLATSTSAATRREGFHGRQKTDATHLLLLGFRVCTVASSLQYYIRSIARIDSL